MFGSPAAAHSIKLRVCEDVVIQAPAPTWLIEGGLPTKATVAQVLASKYAKGICVRSTGDVHRFISHGGLLQNEITNIRACSYPIRGGDYASLFGAVIRRKSGRLVGGPPFFVSGAVSRLRRR